MPSSSANFHVYVLAEGSVANRVASTTEDGLGACLRVLAEEGQITPYDAVGVLLRDSDEDRGTWLANPFARRK